MSATKKYLGTGSPLHSSIGLINLGCVRNLVDSQIILERLKRKGHPIVDVQNADIAIVNTCSFIEEARKESIDVILELIDLKKEGRLKKIIVAGCFAQRYGAKLLDELKGIDALVGTLALGKKDFATKVSLTPPHVAYVKICESCYNECSFCAIPQIKGKFVSRPMSSILEEVWLLDRRGVKEINIVGQDISAYGMDIYKKFALAPLLKKICRTAKNIQWVRLLYLFPAHVTDELIETIATEEKVCKYVDIPLQHISDRILRLMNRGMYQKGTERLIKKIKKRIPSVKLRTTFIVGFPSETEEEFTELMNFVKATKFQHVGVFLYSPEENTPARDLPNQIPLKIKRWRYNKLMQTQQKISKQVLSYMVGQKEKVLIDEKQKGHDNIYIARTSFYAPDVDGVVYVHTADSYHPGDMIDVEITDAYEYDLVAVPISSKKKKVYSNDVTQ